MSQIQIKPQLCIALLAIVSGLFLAPSAQAEFTLEEFGVRLSEDGQFSRKAGAHPDLHVHLAFGRTSDRKEPDGNPHEARVDLPPGLLGNPTNFPACDFNDLVPNGASPFADCPIGSQVGFALISTVSSTPVDFGDIGAAVYNMSRPDDAPALLGINAASVAVVIEPRVRAGSYGITSYSRAISSGLTPFYVNVDLWGVPADPAHDGLRLVGPYGSNPSPELRKPFLSSPTTCPGTPLEFKAFADSWQNIGVFSARSTTLDRDGTPFVMTGCEQVPFDPAARVKSESTRADSPTGVDVDLTVPQGNSPDGLATAHVRKTAVTFPEGMAVAPGSAAGQKGCSEGEIGIGSSDAPTCPDSSRIGSVQITTPLLDDPLEGSLYLAEPHRNPFGSLLATYLAVKGPGFFLKLAGEVEADPNTGQLTATFEDQPQLPYESVSVSLRGGPGAPLVTPSRCGTYETKVAMTSWASPVPVTLDAPITIDQGCETGGFNPSLTGGTTNPIAGDYSPFVLRVTRADGEQNLSQIAATLPEGLLAKLAGVPLCADAAAATGACPAASQIGTTVVAVGAGPTPLFVPEAGKEPTAVYLAGPYKGAPYSLVVKVPAKAGPFDLGTVAVRSSIHIDPVTAQVSVSSDPLPQILEGIPIAYRDVRVMVDRPQFTLNPTDCSASRLTSQISSAEGASASPSPRFAVAGCGELGFRPKLRLALKGKVARRAHPSLRATLTARPGDANIARAQVKLPKAAFLDNDHIDGVCSRVQFAADSCPADSIYGKASATTPLLDYPLAGPIYLRSNPAHKLPDLVVAFQGPGSEPIEIELAGKTDSVKGALRNTFEAVPDVPVTRFQLELFGGKRGLIEMSSGFCKSPRASFKFTAQNAMTYATSPKVEAKCPTAKGRGGRDSSLK